MRGERRPLVAVIGDGGVDEGAGSYQLARRLGELLVDAGFRVLTGGLGGIMEAACLGARRSARYREGDTVGILPGHDPGDANPAVDIAIASGLDLVRNSLVGHSDAVIAVGGGAGTLSEMAVAWMLRRLLIAFRVEGWSGKLADTRVDPRIRYDDIPDDRVYGVDRPEEAIDLLDRLLPLYGGASRTARRASTR